MQPLEGSRETLSSNTGVIYISLVQWLPLICAHMKIWDMCRSVLIKYRKQGEKTTDCWDAPSLPSQQMRSRAVLHRKVHLKWQTCVWYYFAGTFSQRTLQLTHSVCVAHAGVIQTTGGPNVFLCVTQWYDTEWGDHGKNTCSCKGSNSFTLQT